MGTTKDRRLLELELNTWVRSLVTEMTEPGDELQASIRCAMPAWWWKISRITRASSREAVRGAALPVEGMDVNLSLVSQMQRRRRRFGR
ncbi:hypothetical protein LAD59_20485 [Klebsiella pneumoniae]|nr:hypothetical protein [Klebsiella pneumoniae]